MHSSRQKCMEDGVQHTFLFADLVGYTAFTERVGDDAAADVAVASSARRRAPASPRATG
jgi:class 3 adenylate cyclase